MSMIDKIILNGDPYDVGGGSGSGLTEDMKEALIQLLSNVAYIDSDGEDYISALEDALYPPASLIRISAVYTQDGIVYDTALLDSLKPNLVVTAHYDDGTTEVVSSYTLSGTLTAGTRTITVSCYGKTTTFNVVVTSTWLYVLEDAEVTVDTMYTTNVDLISQDIDYTICFDATITARSGAYKLFYEWEIDSPWRGLTVGRGNTSSNDFNAKYIANYTTLQSGIASSLTSAKIVVTHSKNSGSLKIYFRLNEASTTGSKTITEAFVALNSQTTGVHIGRHSDANNWAGTINRFYIRNFAFTAAQVEEFMNGGA